jgi:alpha-ketoglutarate-dependent taurine dioxygenase
MLSIDYSSLNGSNYNVPDRFLIQALSLSSKKLKSKHLDWFTIVHCLQKLIVQEWSELQFLGDKIIKILESEQGFVIIKNLPFRFYKRPVLDYLFASLSLCLGNLTVHNSCNNVIWEVTPRSNLEGREPTFSELNVEAPLHTDSAFRTQPEKYFGLWAITSAKQGGHSTAIKVKELIKFLTRSTSGKECLNILRGELFPFRVPPAFASNSKQSQIIHAPIVTNSPLIRFRIDTLMAGFRHHPELATPERLWAVKYFEEAIKTYPNKLEFKLDDGDLVFFNNHTMLHGRTAFADRKRLLLRIRIDRD